LKLIKFEQPNCNPCKLVSNYLDSKSVEYERINVVDEPEKASEFGIMGVPVIILLDDSGNEVKRLVGFKVSELDELISQLN
jgi:thioredoxin 1